MFDSIGALSWILWKKNTIMKGWKFFNLSILIIYKPMTNDDTITDKFSIIFW